MCMETKKKEVCEHSNPWCRRQLITSFDSTDLASQTLLIKHVVGPGGGGVYLG